MDEEAQAAAARLVRRLKDGYTITIAESCTGGLLASTLTDIAGASKWFNQSWVTYSYDAKIRELNVDPKTLEKRGAVSAEVAIQMAQGALARANADIAISIKELQPKQHDGTKKKVGFVYVGIASRTWAIAEATQIGGNRQENKQGFVHFALLTAIRHWDQAMELAEQTLKDEIKQREEQARLKALEEIERNKRAAAAAQSAEWQSQSWSGDLLVILIQILERMLNGQVIQQTNEHEAFWRVAPLAIMTAEWGVISQELMKRGILVTTGVKEKLLSLDDPMTVLNQASNVGFERGCYRLIYSRK